MARRKKTSTDERYSEFLGIQLRPSQRRMIEDSAAAAGLSLADYARGRLAGNPIFEARSRPDAAAIRALAAEVTRVGNNLNRLARIASQTGAIPSEERLAGVSEELLQVFKRIIRL